jgi:hypothetical protein
MRTTTERHHSLSIVFSRSSASIDLSVDVWRSQGIVMRVWSLSPKPTDEVEIEPG